MTATTILSDNGVLSGVSGLKTAGGNDGTLQLQTTTSGGTATTAVTIDNSQNVGIGVTPSAWQSARKALQVNTGGSISGTTNKIEVASNLYLNSSSDWIYTTSSYGALYDQASGKHTFYVAPSGTAGAIAALTAGMTIDNSGNLLVGTANASTTVGEGFKYNPGNGTNGQLAMVVNSTNSGNTALTLYSTANSTYRFYVTMDGVIHATSTSISAISDQTLKTNVRDLETGLTEVMALKPRRFDWINDDGTNVAGFIAQEVEQVLPDLVMDSLYSQDEEGNPITKKNLKMGDILPTLVKAIQEQQAIINAQQTALTTLTERITALETK